MKLKLICALSLLYHCATFAQTAQEWFEKAVNGSDANQRVACFTKAIQLGYQPLFAAYVGRSACYSDLQKLAQAIADADSAIRLDRQSPYAYFLRGTAQVAQYEGQFGLIDLTKVTIHQLRSAVWDMNKVIELDNQFSDAYRMRAMIRLCLGDTVNVFADIDKAIGFKKNDPINYATRGIFKIQAGQPINAIEDANYAISLDSNEIIGYYLRGLIYAMLEQYNLAIIDLNKVVDKRYRLEYTYLVRGMALLELGQFQAALEDADAALQLKQNPHYYYCRAQANAGLKRWQNTVTDYNKTIELGFKNAEVYYERGLIHYEIGNYQQVISDCDKAIIEGYEPLSVVYNLRGVSKESLGQYAYAVVDYTKAIEQHPWVSPFYSNRGKALRSLKQLQKALADYTKAIELQPNNTEAYIGRSAIYGDIFQYQEAILDATKAIELHHEPLGVAYYNRGCNRSKVQQIQNAIADFDSAALLKYENMNLYLERGDAKRQLGQYKAAVLDYDYALKFNPKHYHTWCSRALMKHFLLQYQAAISDFNKAIEILPMEAKAYNLRGKVYLDLGEYAKAIEDYDKSIALGGLGYIPEVMYRDQAERKLNRLDYTPPKISITEPLLDEQNMGIRPELSKKIILRGRVTDSTGVQKVLINGKPIEFGKDGMFYSELETSIHRIVVQAIDKRGNKATQVIQMAVEPDTFVRKVAEKRLALVVGNSKYRNWGQLGSCPINDAEDMAAALKRLGFEVIPCTDLTLDAFKRKLKEFTTKLPQYDLSFLFYAGHGLGLDNVNYLLPTDFPMDPPKNQVYKSAINLDSIQQMIAASGKGKNHILVIDACRDDGKLRSLQGAQAVWAVNQKVPTGFIVAQAVPQGATSTNCDGRNGFYTGILLKYLEAPLLLEQVFSRVRKEIEDRKGNVPEENPKLTKDIYLKQN